MGFNLFCLTSKIYIFISCVADLTTTLAALKETDKKDECISHALKVRSSWWLGNYHSFFKLYKTAPRMAAFLMDWFLARERKIALKHMIKVYVFTLLLFFEIILSYAFVSRFPIYFSAIQMHKSDYKTYKLFN